jgi:hypothetical protein
MAPAPLAAVAAAAFRAASPSSMESISFEKSLSLPEGHCQHALDRDRSLTDGVHSGLVFRVNPQTDVVSRRS